MNDILKYVMLCFAIAAFFAGCGYLQYLYLMFPGPFISAGVIVGSFALFAMVYMYFFGK